MGVWPALFGTSTGCPFAINNRTTKRKQGLDMRPIYYRIRTLKVSVANGVMQTGVSFVICIVDKIVPESVGAIQGQKVIDHDRVAVHARDDERRLTALVLLDNADTSFV